MKYAKDVFNPVSNPTVPSRMTSHYQEKMEQVTKDDFVILSLWDTAGEEEYSAMTQMYYKGADAAILVYDVTIQDTVDRIKKWQMELNEFGDNKGIKVYVVGNKCDLNNQRIESNDRGLAFANQNSCYHVFASAKSGLGVAELFQQIA